METALTQNLNELFDFAPPHSLRNNIHEVFFSYLLDKDRILRENFDTIVTDFYFLIKFLEAVEYQTVANSGLPQGQ